MKRIVMVWLSGAVMAATSVGLAAAQSQNENLAAYARQKKKEKPANAPKVVYDNDNIPKTEHISVVGQTPVAKTASLDESAQPAAEQPPKEQPNDGSEAKADAQAKPKIDITPDTSPEDRQKGYADWQKKIADQKQTVGLLTRELDVLQREYKLRAAAMYADAGNRLRNQTQWDKENKEYKEQIEAKQKDVDRAKQQLADLQNQARKAGVPSGMRQ